MISRQLGVAVCAVIFALVAAPLCVSASQNLNQLTPEEKEDGWMLLFNGTDTSGWVNYQGPEWTIQDGLLIGPSTSSGWLGTDAIFDNFQLKLEYWVDKGDTHESNSGIFIRADKDSEQPWVDGYELQISLEDPKNPTGSIYNIVPTSITQLNEEKIAPQKQWNQVEIRCMNSRIQAWYNGNPLQDAYLHVRDQGVIGIQQHHPGVTIKYRNIKIKKLTASDAEEGWVPCFNGKDLEGWEVFGKGFWTVEDGTLVGRGTSLEGVKGGMGHIYYKARKFKNYEMRAMIKCNTGGNSGFYFHARHRANPDDWPDGYEAQVDVTDDNWTTGAIYGMAKAKALITLEDRWFSMRVRCIDNHYQVWVNGQLMVDHQDPKQEYEDGWIALQCHDPGTVIMYKDIYYRPLD